MFKLEMTEKPKIVELFCFEQLKKKTIIFFFALFSLTLIVRSISFKIYELIKKSRIYKKEKNTWDCNLMMRKKINRFNHILYKKKAAVRRN